MKSFGNFEVAKENLSEVDNWNNSLFKICNNIPLSIVTMKHTNNSYLYRARKINALTDLQMWNKKDFGTRKSYSIREYGRLNKPYEEVLYFNNDFRQILKEIDYDYTSPVVISTYKIIDPFVSTRIAYENGTVTKEAHECLTWFKDLFSNNTDIDPAISNRITTAIRDDFYTLPINVAQAWSYPIVGEQCKGIYNLAMYPDLARKHLEFEGAIVVSKANLEGRMDVEFCFDQDYRLDYVKEYSELKRIFGL